MLKNNLEMLLFHSRYLKQKNYWTGKLSVQEETTDILKDSKQYGGDTFVTGDTPAPVNREHYEIPFDDEISRRVLNICKHSELSLYIFLLSILNTLIHRYSNLKDIIILSPIHSGKATEKTINNLVLIRREVDGTMTFKELVLSLKNSVLEAYENQDYPYEKLREFLFPSFSLTHISCWLENIHRKADIEKIKTRLSFGFSTGGEKIEGFVRCNPNYYRESDIHRLAGHFLTLLTRVSENLNTRIANVEFLTGEEKRQLLVDFNRNQADFCKEKTLPQSIEEQVWKSPDAAAICFKHHSISYRELNKKANQSAAFLRNNGLQPNQTVGILLDRSPGMVESILAAWKAGGAYIPLDTDLPIERLRYMLEDSQPPFLLTNDKTAEKYTFTGLQGFQQSTSEISVTRPRPQILDFDTLPFPDRSLVNYEKYHRYIGLAAVKNCIALQTTRGCPYHCAYCLKIWPKSHVVRSAENIFNEVRLLYNIGIRRFAFVDDIFNLNIENSTRFFQLIIDHGLELQLFFPNGLRGDLLTKDYIDLMIQVGTVNIALALETASPRLQKLIGKDLNLEKLSENIQYIYKRYPHVILELFTMHGFPSETEEEAMMTLDFIKRHRWIHFPYVEVLKIFPNTDMERLALRYGVSKEAIYQSENLAFHEIPETLPFDKTFTSKYQADFLNNYFLSKERLLHVLPQQMRRLTEDEMVEKYNSYLPVDINCFSHLLDFVGISRSELGVKELQPDTEMKVEHLNQEIARYFPPGEVEKDALRVLLLDLSQFFSGHSQMIYDVVEAPLGLIYLMTYLNHRFGSKINGKIAKSRIDFDNYQGLKELLEEFKPDIIGIRTLTFFKDFFHQTAAMIRQWGIEAPIIVGGPYATSSYKECLQDGNIDLVVLGEGEITFSQVIQTIMENHRQLPGDEFLESIPGIAFRPGRHRLPQQRGRQLVMLDRLSRQLSLESGENLLPLHQPADTAYIIFTSGSTGKPKGAIVEHGGMMNHIHAKIDDLRLTAASIVAQNASHTFDISVWQFFAALVSGGKTVIYSNQLMLEPGAFISRIDDDKITILEVVPSYLSVMLDTLAITPGKFRQLDYLLVTGEVVKPNLVKGWFEKFPGIKMVNAYGPTEASDDITHFIMDKPIGMERVPIGKPIRNLTIYLLDEYMNLCPPGITGEICVSGIGVGRGYLNNPELTAEKFINPKSQIPNKAGYYRSYRSYKSYILYKTGDLGRWLPDGSIEFLGRKDYQVKIRGFRIEVEEIEKQILNHGSFKEAVVIDKEDKQASKYLCAYLTGGENSQLPGLKSYLEKQLPGYMVPAYFVELMEMPLTTNGKIDRKALPDPTGISLPEASQYVPPVSNLEKKLVEIWEKVLGRKNIGINANFFMTGGDSIKAIQIMARMGSAGYKLDIRDLFQYPVISQLAPYIKKMERITEQAAITGTIPLTPIQEEFFNQSYSAPHHYNQAVLLFSKEGFDKGVIKEVFTRIQEHHDALRMTYKKDGDSGQVVQVAHGLDFPLSLHQYDLRNRETGLEEFKTKVNQIQASIDLEKGPLMKLGLFRLDDGDRLLVVVHHLVIDGVSWRILFEDIDALYGQYKQGAKPVLPEKTSSFKLWSEKLSAYANSKTFLKEKTYWQKIESVEPFPIPGDFEVVANDVKDTESVSFTLREEDTERLLTKVNETFRTKINDILLTALGMGIKKTFARDQVLVMLEGHGREEIPGDMNIHRTVGWFTSVYPVLIDISSTGDLGRQIKEIKDTLRRIPNKGIGYGILKYLTGEENKKENQFKIKPQISFNYMGQFDEDVKQMSYFEIAGESVGNTVSIENQREYELDVVGMTVNNRLTMTISFNKTHFKPGTISTLKDNLETGLKQIIEFCCSREKIERTPGDFIYKGLSIESVDRLMESYPNTEELYTLTPMQEGMLFHALADDLSHHYFLQTSYRLQGQLYIRHIERSLNELVKRYDILRTAFVYKDIERPVQLVLRDRAIDFYYEDISHLEGSEEKENFIKEFKKRDKDRSFDLSKGTLMRVSIHRLDKSGYDFTWSFHHILMDGWCIGILNNEFFEIYNSYLENRPYRLPIVKPYRTYIQWLEKQDKNASAGYWQNYLDSFEEQTGVPRTRRLTKEGNQTGYRNETVSLVLDTEKTAGLNKLASRNHVTLNTVTQAVWGILLGKYNGKEDVVFGAVVSGRPSELEGVESIVGLFINAIPVRIHFEEKMKFSRLLRQVQEEALAGETYHYHPLAEIQSGNPLKQNLIDHLFIFENYPIAEQIESNKTSLKLANIEIFEQTNYDFNVIVEGAEQLKIIFLYNGNVYEEGFVERIAKHFTLTFDQVIENRELEVGKLTLLSAEEKNRILYEFNYTAVEYPKDKTIHRLFEEQLERSPDNTALHGGMIARMQGEEGSITYKELNEKARKLARELRIKGVGTDTIVGIMMERSVEMIIGIFGILKAGGAYLPIDPEYPPDRIDYMLKDSGAKVLVTASGLSEKFKKLSIVNCQLLMVNEEAYRRSLNNPPKEANSINNLQLKGNNLAYVIYTSGTTGKPKGVVIEHRSLVNRLNWMQKKCPLNTTDTILQKTTYTFDVSLWEIFWWSMVGASVCLLIPGGEKDPEIITQTVERYNITTIHFVPSMLSVFLDYLKENGNVKRLSGLKQVFASGEALLSVHVEWFNELLNKENGAALANLYGPTEATVDVSYFDCREGGEKEIIPLGKPIDNLCLYILDKTLQIQPVGVTGELCISGIGLARGYLNRPGLTSEKFDHDLWDWQDYHDGFHRSHRSYIIYKTGDLARWLPDGNIEFLGRIDQQVKIKGCRIELEEIESRLLNIGEVKEVVVSAREKEGGGKYICAYFIADKVYEISELRDNLAKELPDYMIPSYFVQLEKIPLTPHGKVDRSALPGPEGIHLKEDVRCTLPSSVVEKKLVEIWENVLGRNNIGINDNFFMMGGDSIKSILIISRMSSAGYKLEMKDLFKYPVISALAPRVKKLKRIPDQSAIKGIIPLTPIQGHFFSNTHIDTHHYNQAVLLYSREGFAKEAIMEVFSKIQEHHDVLRITYKLDTGKGEIVQIGHDPGYPLSLQEYDLKNRGTSAAEFNAKLNHIQASIDLEKGPLLKLGLFHLDDGDRLLIAVHHLVIDGVSWRILFEDIETLYGQYKRGEKLVLPSKTDSFKLWSEKLSAFADDKIFLQEKAFWQKIESAEVPSIPRDFAGDDNYSKDTVSVSFILREEETEDLLTKVNQIFRTEINDILLTALGMGIKKTWGHDRVLIALEGHGREEIPEDMDISRTIGWFTSLYPVLLEVCSIADPGRRIKEIKETLRRIPNKGVGYGILKYLTGARNKKEIRFKAKPQISFNYLGQFDADVKRKSFFEIARESVGNLQSLNTKREYVLDVSGMTANSRLTMTISYNKMQFKPETMTQFIGNFESALKHLIAFCCAQENIERTPSDFTYKGLTVERVDGLMKEYPGIEDIYTLTPMQEGMLFHSLVDESSASYFQQMSYRLQGELDLDVVEKSLNELFKRHDILRTAFVYKDIERPVQVVLKERAVDFYYEDISQIGEREEKQVFIDEYKGKDKDRLFNLEKDVLMRVSIFKVDESGYEFTWSFHHILMDGWCIGILNTEFFEIYTGYMEKRSYRLPGVKAYGTYIQWLERQDKEKSARYWANYLDSFADRTGVPKTRISKEDNKYRNETVSVVLDKEKTAGLNKLAGGNHVTLNTVTQAVWGILLGKYNGKEDVVFGAVVSGRPSELEGVESMVGLFINTIPVRITFEEKTKFYRLLKQVQRDALAGEPYHYHSLADIQAGTALKQNLIDHLFIYENYPIAEQIEGYGREKKIVNKISLKLANVEIFEQTNYEFNIILIGSDRLRITFTYNGNVYDGDFVERMAKHFCLAVDQVIENRELEVGEITLLSTEEKNRILYEFNDTAAVYPPDKTIHRLFEEQGEQTPDRIALVGPGSRDRRGAFLKNRPLDPQKTFYCLTYRQLNEQSNRLAGLLIGKGIRPDTIVGIMAERSVEMIVGILGILKSGGAYLPIDPEYPEEHINYMLTDSRVNILIKNSNIISDLKCMQELLVLNFEHLNFKFVSNFDIRISDLNASNLAYIIYTSGSTGKPKGVMIDHGSIFNTIYWRKQEYKMKPGDRTLQLFSVAFDGFLTSFFTPVVSGVMVVQLRSEEVKDIARIKETIVSMGITHFICVPPLYRSLMEISTGKELSPLKVVTLAGDRVHPGIVEKSKRIHPWLEIYNEYGPTEGSVVASFYRDLRPGGVISIGRPIANAVIYIIDKNINLVPIGIPGQLAIAGKGLARGYMNQPELTAQKFDQDLWDLLDYHDGYHRSHRSYRSYITHKSYIYRTGDLARWLPGGNIEFLGRIDHQIKIRGFRIELGEIESRLLAHDDIMEAVVIPMEKENQEGEKYLCAYYVSSGEGVTGELLQEYLAGYLPDYMVPSYFAALDRIPLLPNGKVARKALPLPGEPGRNNYAPPRNPVEQKLVDLWSEVLAIEKEKIGIDDNFFQLGGHSLRVTVMIAKVQKELHAQLPLKEIFQYPTIKGISGLISAAEWVSNQEITAESESEKENEKKEVKRIVI